MPNVLRRSSRLHRAGFPAHIDIALDVLLMCLQGSTRSNRPAVKLLNAGHGHPIGRRVAVIASVAPISTSAAARSKATSKRPVTDTI
jgi:hypothetical protein